MAVDKDTVDALPWYHGSSCPARQADSRWWTPNRAAHRRWMVAAGFEIVDSSGWTFQPFGPLATGQQAGQVVPVES